MFTEDIIENLEITEIAEVVYCDSEVLNKDTYFINKTYTMNTESYYVDNPEVCLKLFESGDYGGCFRNLAHLTYVKRHYEQLLGEGLNICYSGHNYESLIVRVNHPSVINSDLAEIFEVLTQYALISDEFMTEFETDTAIESYETYSYDFQEAIESLIDNEDDDDLLRDSNPESWLGRLWQTLIHTQGSECYRHQYNDLYIDFDYLLNDTGKTIAKREYATKLNQLYTYTIVVKDTDEISTSDLNKMVSDHMQDSLKQIADSAMTQDIIFTDDGIEWSPAYFSYIKFAELWDRETCNITKQLYELHTTRNLVVIVSKDNKPVSKLVLQSISLCNTKKEVLEATNENNHTDLGKYAMLKPSDKTENDFSLWLV